MKKKVKIGIGACGILLLLIYVYVTNTAFKMMDGTLLIGVTNKTKLAGKLVLPKKVTKIGERAFSGCKDLTEVDLSGCTSLTAIGYRAFLRETRFVVPTYTFKRFLQDGGISRWNITIKGIELLIINGDDKITGVTDKTKLNGKLVLPAGVKEIGDEVFSGCAGITEVRFPASLTKIRDWAFRGCTGLTEVDLSGCTSLTAIDGSVFSDCTGITEIDLSGCTSLTAIVGPVFYGCTGLTKIRFPASLTEIKYLAFSGCTGLTEVDLSACTNLTKLGGLAFANISPTARFIVATETVKELLKDSKSGIKDEQITVKDGK